MTAPLLNNNNRKRTTNNKSNLQEQGEQRRHEISGLISKYPLQQQPLVLDLLVMIGIKQIQLLHRNTSKAFHPSIVELENAIDSFGSVSEPFNDENTDKGDRDNKESSVQREEIRELQRQLKQLEMRISEEPVMNNEDNRCRAVANNDNNTVASCVQYPSWWGHEEAEPAKTRRHLQPYKEHQPSLPMGKPLKQRQQQISWNENNNFPVKMVDEMTQTLSEEKRLKEDMPKLELKMNAKGIVCRGQVHRPNHLSDSQMSIGEDQDDVSNRISRKNNQRPAAVSLTFSPPRNRRTFNASSSNAMVETTNNRNNEPTGNPPKTTFTMTNAAIRSQEQMEKQRSADNRVDFIEIARKFVCDDFIKCLEP